MLVRRTDALTAGHLRQCPCGQLFFAQDERRAVGPEVDVLAGLASLFGPGEMPEWLAMDSSDVAGTSVIVSLPKMSMPVTNRRELERRARNGMENRGCMSPPATRGDVRVECRGGRQSLRVSTPWR